MKARTLSVLVFSLLAACNSKEAPHAAVEPAPSGPAKPAAIKVGVLTPLTGDAASYGKYTKQGLELAQSQEKSDAIVLVFKDTRADPLEAVRMFKELRAAGAEIVIGPFTSTEVRQVGPEAERAATTLITTSATADDLSSIGEHVFMMLPPNSKQGADQATFASEKLGAARAAILYRENPYGQTLRQSFAATFKERGGKIVADLGFPDNEESFQDRLKQIKATDPQVVFVAAHDADTGRILRQAREVKMPSGTRYLGADGSMSATMIKLAGDAAEGSVFSNVASVSAAFDTAFKAKYGEDPSPYSASANDAYRIVVKLVADGARHSEDFRRGLVALSGFEGATGNTKFVQKEKAFWALDKPYRQFEVKASDFHLMR
jgi:branched-chain amino acid transport system substrate-binding protein